MSKRTNEGTKDRPTTEEAAPPLLSEKLIAQLQGAVSDARRRRKSDPDDASAIEAVDQIRLPNP